MSRFVLDASATLAWLLADERDDEARFVLGELVTSGAVAPSHWPLEVANGLIAAQRRGRISEAERREAFRELTKLDLELDQNTAQQAWTSTVDLAIAHGLTVYDAAYLETALRRGTRIATRDKALQAASRSRGVEVLA